MSNPEKVHDDQITVSSGRSGLPRLGISTWKCDLSLDPDPWVEIDFLKPTVIKAINIHSPSISTYPALCLGIDFIIFDQN